MLLTISTTHFPATDLGYLLHKHPDKVQTFATSGGRAHVFYPEATDNRATASLLLDLDPIDLVRKLPNSGNALTARHYVNDRPFVASSFMSSAIATVYSSALNGRCADRPELVDERIPLTVYVSVVRARGGEDVIRRVFEPLGYGVSVQGYALDEQFPAWGQSPYFTVRLTNSITVQQLLQHLYVLLPVLDNERHYFMTQQDVEILLKKGEGWLAQHPDREWITSRYFKHLSRFANQVLNRLTADDDETADDTTETEEANTTEIAKRVSLHSLRLDAALDVIKLSGAASVLDLGCGEGQLLKRLLREPQFTRIAGMDVAYRDLMRAKKTLQVDELLAHNRDRLTLFQGSLLYRDGRLSGFDAAALVEVIEHIEPDRLPALEQVVFMVAAPKTVVVTTPNAEYNALYNMEDGLMRHNDHRFEWSRAEFAAWANRVADQNRYTVAITGVGQPDQTVGASSQMAVFQKIKTPQR